MSCGERITIGGDKSEVERRGRRREGGGEGAQRDGRMCQGMTTRSVVVMGGGEGEGGRQRERERDEKR